jgi:hypothetical protein
MTPLPIRDLEYVVLLCRDPEGNVGELYADVPVQVAKQLATSRPAAEQGEPR